jgi:hypothetical protein
VVVPGAPPRRFLGEILSFLKWRFSYQSRLAGAQPQSKMDGAPDIGFLTYSQVSILSIEMEKRNLR